MNSTLQTYLDTISNLQTKLQEKDTQIQELEKVILNMYKMYGVKKDDKYKSQEDRFVSEYR